MRKPLHCQHSPVTKAPATVAPARRAQKKAPSPASAYVAITIRFVANGAEHNRYAQLSGNRRPPCAEAGSGIAVKIKGFQSGKWPDKKMFAAATRRGTLKIRPSSGAKTIFPRTAGKKKTSGQRKKKKAQN